MSHGGALAVQKLNSATTLIQRDNQGDSPLQSMYYIGLDVHKKTLQRDSQLAERVQRLMTIPAVGPITALTWVLEVGDVKRFSSIEKAISYCGLCGAEKSSAETIKRTPLSKERNKHLQSVLVEAAKMAPRLSPELALIYDRETASASVRDGRRA